jgi:alpha-1,3-mannosyltransferase
VPVLGPDVFPVPRGGYRLLWSLVRDADVVHVHDLRFALEPTVAAARRNGTPLVLTTHGLIFHTPRLQTAKFLAWRSYYRAVLSRFDVVACGSERDLDYCRRARLDNARLVQNPVAVEGFLDVERAPGGIGALLYFGRLAPNKGIERLARVLDLRPEWTLTVVGTGAADYVERLRTHFDPTQATFVGPVSDDELRERLARADCVVLPSYEEGFGLALVEAMAAGAPVVASDIAPFREIASDTSVRLVDFDDEAATSAAVAAALHEEESASARTRAATFSWRIRAPEFATLYRELATG